MSNKTQMPLLFNVVLDIPAEQLGKKNIKGIQIGKEKVKLCLLTHHTILQAENPKECTHTYPKL